MAYDFPVAVWKFRLRTAISVFTSLQDVLNNIPQHDIKLLIGDLTAKVGQEKTGWEHTMGRNGPGVQNSNGEKFIEFCQLNNLVIGGTKFLTQTSAQSNLAVPRWQVLEPD